jgi:hypothetical protein
MKHLIEANETYFTHMKFALSYFWLGLTGTIAVLIHAFIPCCFETTGSRRFSKILESANTRKIFKSDNEHV